MEEIEKIKTPDVICGSWVGSFQYEMMQATNRIIDGLNDLGRRLEKLEKENQCNCS